MKLYLEGSKRPWSSIEFRSLMVKLFYLVPSNKSSIGIVRDFSPQLYKKVTSSLFPFDLYVLSVRMPWIAPTKTIFMSARC